MLEVTEMILASINAKPMNRKEIDELSYLKTISEFGIEYSIDLLVRREFIIEKIIDRHPYRTKEYRATKKGREYLQEHGYFD